jgi:flagellar biosynthesis chaperone FliJ
MPNLKQLDAIKKILMLKRTQKINAMTVHYENINKKLRLIEKMNQYLTDYLDEKKFAFSRQNPVLQLNFHHFVDQIQSVIYCTQNEVNGENEKINRLKEFILSMDQRIKLLDKYIDHVQLGELIKLDVVEQNIMDDLVAIHSFNM